MADVRSAFDVACEQVRAGSFSVSDDERLMLYALFKIAGGASAPSGARPSSFDPVARAKWDAWTEFGKTYSTAQALQLYPQFVGRLAARRTSSK